VIRQGGMVLGEQEMKLRVFTDSRNCLLQDLTGAI